MRAFEVAHSRAAREQRKKQRNRPLSLTNNSSLQAVPTPFAVGLAVRHRCFTCPFAIMFFGYPYVHCFEVYVMPLPVTRLSAFAPPRALRQLLQGS